MRLEMDAVEFLGMPFRAVEGKLSHSGIEHVFDEPDNPALATELCVSATDGTWQLLLDNQERIGTIFLFADKGCKLPFGLRPEMTPAELNDLLGVPTRHAPESVIQYLGPKGSWWRWDTATHCVHVEYEIGAARIRMVTLTMPDHAPYAA